MSCEETRALLALYPYGELTFDQEEVVDAHCLSCAACEQERAALTRLHLALDDDAETPSLELLSACRQDLRHQVAAIAGATSAQPFWRRWFPGSNLWATAARPAMAAGLLCAGFLAARLVPATPPAPASAAVTNAVRNVRFIEPAGDGRVRIVYEEVRQRELDGRVDDKQVRDMLLAATRDPADPALRVDSFEFLKDRAGRDEVRTAFIRALTSDPNEGVRLRALDALKPHATHEDVRGALARVLLSDQSAAVRTHAIDLLVNTRRDESELAGVLQDLMRREQNSYIRQRGQSALRAMNASLETF